MNARIYLDHAATTPIRPEAAAAVAEGLARWANPSSPHAQGRAARAALEGARARIAAALDWDGEVILTSGASEALAIALGRAVGATRYVSAVEHDAVFRAAPAAVVLSVDAGGDVLVDKVADAAPVVAVQHVSSETGRVQSLGPLADAVRAAGGILVADCAQSAGKLVLPDADLIAVSAHKLGGPPGVGALLVRDLAQLTATGGQERGYRGGTENLPGALGFAAALEARTTPPEADAEALLRAHMALVTTIAAAGGEAVGGAGPFCGHIGAYAMPEVSAAAQLIHFDRLGFSVSAGSACASGSLKPSRALAAFGVPREVADRTIRISTGWTTTAADIRAFADAWRDLAAGARARAA